MYCIFFEEKVKTNFTRKICLVNLLYVRSILLISLCSFTNCMCFCRLIVNLSFPMFLVVCVVPLEACIENNNFLTFLLQNKYNIYWTTIASDCIMYVDPYCFQFCFNPPGSICNWDIWVPHVPLINHPHSPELEFINSLTLTNVVNFVLIPWLHL